MKKLLLTTTAVLGLSFLSQAQLSPSYKWAKTLSWGDYTSDGGKNVARVECVDKDGNYYVAATLGRGNAQRTALFAGGDTIRVDASEDALLVTKYDSSGNFLWATKGASGHSQSGNDYRFPKSIIADEAGNLFLAVNFTDSFSYDTVTINQTGNALELFCLQSSDGSVRWHRPLAYPFFRTWYQPEYYENAKLDFTTSNEVAIVYYTYPDSLHIRTLDNTGNTLRYKSYYVGGAYFDITGFSAKGTNYVLSAEITNGFTIGSHNIATANGHSIIISTDNAGEINWIKQFNGKSGVPSYERPIVNTVCQAPDGSVYFGGRFNHYAVIVGTTDSLAIGSEKEAGELELFYGKLSSAGATVWFKKASGEKKHEVWSMKLNKDNKLYMMGQLGSRTMYLGTDSFPRPNSTGTRPYFVAELSDNGDVVWGKRVNDEGSITGEKSVYFHLDDANNIYFSGGYEFVTPTFGGHSVDVGISSPSSEMIRYFLAKTGDRAGLTGIKELRNASRNISVYPNPANDKLFVNVKNAEISIMDLQGKVVKQTTNETTLDITELQQGIYFVKVLADGEMMTSKFVKQ